MGPLAKVNTGKALCCRRIHQRAIVLRQEKRAAQAASFDSRAQRVHRAARELRQRRIQYAGALALEKAQLADGRGQRDRCAGTSRRQKFSRALLEVVAYGRKDSRDRDVGDAASLDVGADLGDFALVELSYRGAVEVHAAGRKIDVFANGGTQVRRPIDHGQQALRGRQA